MQILRSKNIFLVFQLQLYVKTIMWLWDLRLIPSLFFSFSFFVLYFQKTVLFSFICQYRFCLSLHYLQHKHITCGLMPICTLDGLIWRKWSLGWWMMCSIQTTHSILTHKTTLYQNFNARLCFLSLSLSLSLSILFLYFCKKWVWASRNWHEWLPFYDNEKKACGHDTFIQKTFCTFV